jgi:hypothetical protein
MSAPKLLIVTTVSQNASDDSARSTAFLSQRFDVTLATSPGSELTSLRRFYDAELEPLANQQPSPLADR